jgi:hypothetical protein
MSGRLVLPWRGRDRVKQEEVCDGEEASTKAHKKSGEAAEEPITCPQVRSRLVENLSRLYPIEISQVESILEHVFIAPLST